MFIRKNKFPSHAYSKQELPKYILSQVHVGYIFYT